MKCNLTVHKSSFAARFSQREQQCARGDNRGSVGAAAAGGTPGATEQPGSNAAALLALACGGFAHRRCDFAASQWLHQWQRPWGALRLQKSPGEARARGLLGCTDPLPEGCGQPSRAAGARHPAAAWDLLPLCTTDLS